MVERAFIFELISLDFSYLHGDEMNMKKIGLISVVLAASVIGAVVGTLVTLRFSDDRSSYNSIVERQQNFPVR